jgi:putative ubiquitin-RnfH superfamily antitoxin RatB of RatAB toxin-antitoxin module
MGKCGFRTMIVIGMTALTLSATRDAQAAKSGLASQTFKVDESCMIVIPDKKQATLADLKVGDRINIRYQSQSGVLVADRIALPQPRSAKQPKTSSPSGHPQQPPKPTNELHARGTITSINPQANTVTILGKAPRKS